MKRIASLLALMALIAPAARAGDCVVTEDMGFTARDVARIEQIDAFRLRGLSAALAEGTDADQAVLADMYAGGRPAVPDDIAGTYRCRTIKMGGPFSALTVYGYFECRIGHEDASLVLHKTTGSQRTLGVLIEGAQGGLSYRGALYYGYEEPLSYASAEDRDQAGCLSAIATDDNRLLLELPDPYYESDFDLLELVPVN